LFDRVNSAREYVYLLTDIIENGDTLKLRMISHHGVHVSLFPDIPTLTVPTMECASKARVPVMPRGLVKPAMCRYARTIARILRVIVIARVITAAALTATKVRK